MVNENEFCNRISAIRKMSVRFVFHLVINARTDVFITSLGSLQNGLHESIQRGNKYRETGADRIFIPDVWEGEKISTLVNDICAPINILSNPANQTGFSLSLNRLEALGFARVSFGSSLMKSTLNAIKKVSEELIQNGTFHILSQALFLCMSL